MTLTCNGEPAVLFYHGIVRRWRCGSLVTQRPLSLLLSMTNQSLLSMTYQLLLSMTYHFQNSLGKTDCTDIWVIKLKNQISPSIGFRVPHYGTDYSLGDDILKLTSDG